MKQTNSASKQQSENLLNKNKHIDNESSVIFMCSRKCSLFNHNNKLDVHFNGISFVFFGASFLFFLCCLSNGTQALHNSCCLLLFLAVPSIFPCPLSVCFRSPQISFVMWISDKGPVNYTVTFSHCMFCPVSHLFS